MIVANNNSPLEMLAAFGIVALATVLTTVGFNMYINKVRSDTESHLSNLTAES